VLAGLLLVAGATVQSFEAEVAVGDEGADEELGLGSCQLLENCLGRAQVGSVKALSEPAVDQRPHTSGPALASKT